MSTINPADAADKVSIIGDGVARAASLNQEHVEHTMIVPDIDNHDAEIDRLKAELDAAKAQMGFNNLTREQSRQLLDFFMYRLGSTRRTLAELRDELAAALPHAYNAWYGRDVVKVVSVTDPTREWKA